MVPRALREGDAALLPLRGGVLTDDMLYDACAGDLDRLRRARAGTLALDLEVTHTRGDGPETTGDNAPSSSLTCAWYDPAMCLLRPVPRVQPAPAQCGRVLQAFDARPHAHTAHVSSLYVYPEHLSAKHGAGANLRVGAQLVAAGPLAHGTVVALDAAYPALPTLDAAAMAASAATPGLLVRPRLQRIVHSAVQWAEPRPQFADELKFALPPQIDDVAILFTFENVSASGSGSSTTKSVGESIVGYAALNLLDEGGEALLGDGTHHVAVHRTLGELAASGFAHALGAAEHRRARHTFAFRTRAVSSVHAQDAAVARLLREVRRTDTQTTPAARAASLAGLARASPAECARFLLPLLDALMHALCAWGPADSRTAFRALPALLARVFVLPEHRGSEADSPLLAAWVDTLLDPAALARPGVPLEELFLHRWLEYITSGASALASIGNGLCGSVFSSSGSDDTIGLECGTGEEEQCGAASDFNWFFLRIVAKAATVHAVALAEAQEKEPKKGKQEEKECPQRIQLSKTFQDDVERLLQTLLSVYSAQAKDAGAAQAGAQARRANVEAVARFVNALYLFVDRGRLLAHVQRFFAYTDADNRDALLCTAVKFPLLRGLAAYAHYVPLNDAVALDCARLAPADADGVAALLTRRYPLAGVLQREVCSCLRSEHAPVRAHAAHLLRALLRKHRTDPRYQRATIRTRIATMYFPVVLCAVSLRNTLLDPDTASGSSSSSGGEDSSSSAGNNEDEDLVRSVVWILEHCDQRLVAAWLARETEPGRAAFFGLLAHCVAALHGRGGAQEAAVRAACGAAAAFVRAHSAELRSARDPVFQSVYDAVVLAFEECAPPALGAVLAAVDALLRAVPEQFFAYAANSFVENIAHNIMRAWCTLCTGPHAPALERALVDVFCALAAQSHAHSGDTRRVRVQTALAAARLVGEDAASPLDTPRLLAFLDAVDARAEGGVASSATCDARASPSTTSLQQGMKEITGRVRTLLDYHVKIAAARDEDTTADLYYATICAHEESPDLRATWLQNLAATQARRGNWEEAAQCNVLVALMVAQYLARVSHAPLAPADFGALTPDPAARLAAVDVRAAQDDGQFQSDVWSRDALAVLLQQAYTYLARGAHYEQCVEVLSLLTTLWKRERNYPRMVQALRETTAVCAALRETAADRAARPPARYYRVAFHGPRAGPDLRGREFIYRRPPACVLSVVQHEIRQLLLPRVAGRQDRLHLLPNRDFDLEKAQLDPEVIYYQISSVEPYHDGDSSSNSNSNSFDRHFGVHTFVFVQAYGGEGQKAHAESLQDQAKRKTIFETGAAFPFVERRLEVVARRTVVLAPIETAIELVAERCERLREQLACSPPRLNPLQQVLQGSVAPMVNEGPLRVCEAFLSPEAARAARPAHVALLATATCNFLELCAAALQLDQMLIGPQHRRFHAMLEAHYDALYAAVARYLAPITARVPKRAFTADDLDRQVWRDQPPVVLPL